MSLKKKESELVQATYDQNYEKIEQLFKDGVDPNCVDLISMRFFPLITIPVCSNNLDICKLFIKYGAKPHVNDGYLRNNVEDFTNNNNIIKFFYQEQCKSNIWKPFKVYGYNAWSSCHTEKKAIDGLFFFCEELVKKYCGIYHDFYDMSSDISNEWIKQQKKCLENLCPHTNDKTKSFECKFFNCVYIDVYSKGDFKLHFIYPNKIVLVGNNINESIYIDKKNIPN
jgi:hypothetical protein